MPDVSAQEVREPPITEKKLARDQVFDDAIRRASLKKEDHYLGLVNALNEVRAKDNHLSESEDRYYPGEAFTANGVLAVAELLSAPESDKEQSFYIGEPGGTRETKNIIELLTDAPEKIVPEKTERLKKHLLSAEFIKESTYKLPDGIHLVEEYTTTSLETPGQLTKRHTSSSLYAVRPQTLAPAQAA